MSRQRKAGPRPNVRMRQSDAAYRGFDAGADSLWIQSSKLACHPARIAPPSLPSSYSNRGPWANKSTRTTESPIAPRRNECHTCALHTSALATLEGHHHLRHHHGAHGLKEFRVSRLDASQPTSVSIAHGRQSRDMAPDRDFLVLLRRTHDRERHFRKEAAGPRCQHLQRCVLEVDD